MSDGASTPREPDPSDSLWVVDVVAPLAPGRVRLVAADAAARLNLPVEKLVSLLENRIGPVTKPLPQRSAERVTEVLNAAGAEVEMRGARASDGPPSAAREPAPPATDEVPDEPEAAAPHARAPEGVAEAPAPTEDEPPGVAAEEHPEPEAARRPEAADRPADPWRAMARETDARDADADEAMLGDWRPAPRPAKAARPAPEPGERPATADPEADAPGAVSPEPEPLPREDASEAASGPGTRTEYDPYPDPHPEPHPDARRAGRSHGPTGRTSAGAYASAPIEADPERADPRGGDDAPFAAPAASAPVGGAGREGRPAGAHPDQASRGVRASPADGGSPGAPSGDDRSARAAPTWRTTPTTAADDEDDAEDTLGYGLRDPFAEAERRERALRRGVLAGALVLAAIVFLALQWAYSRPGPEGTTPPAYEVGLAAYRDGAFVSAARAWLPRAEAGDPRAMYMLGYMAELGQGRPWSNAEAAGWYRQAAQRDHAASQLRLASLYASGMGVPRDGEAALSWTLAAAGAGLPEAQLRAARLLAMEGRHEEAFGWLRRAAPAEPEAGAWLGMLDAVSELDRLSE